MNFCPGIGAEWEGSHLGLEGDIVQYLQGILGNTVTERGKLLVQRSSKELGEELKNHQQPDKNDQEIKNDAENHDKQSPDPGIYIFQVFFNVHIPSSLSNDVNEEKHKKNYNDSRSKNLLDPDAYQWPYSHMLLLNEEIHFLKTWTSARRFSPRISLRISHQGHGSGRG